MPRPLEFGFEKIKERRGLRRNWEGETTEKNDGFYFPVIEGSALFSLPPLAASRSTSGMQIMMSTSIPVYVDVYGSVYNVYIFEANGLTGEKKKKTLLSTQPRRGVLGSCYLSFIKSETDRRDFPPGYSNEEIFKGSIRSRNP